MASYTKRFRVWGLGFGFWGSGVSGLEALWFRVWGGNRLRLRVFGFPWLVGVVSILSHDPRTSVGFKVVCLQFRVAGLLKMGLGFRV